jgi:hypothetical protein
MMKHVTPGEKIKKGSKPQQSIITMLDIVVSQLLICETKLDLKYANTFSLCLQTISACCLSSEEVVSFTVKVHNAIFLGCLEAYRTI